jgi:LemA protein
VRRGLEHDRRAAEAPSRPDPQPRRDREGLRHARDRGARTPAEAAKTESFLTQALGQLFAIAEAYPQLRAVESFTQLQAELANTEDQISAARRVYNGNVQTYMTKCQQFPGALFAGPFGFSPRAFFELDTPAEREPVKVDFSS